MSLELDWKLIRDLVTLGPTYMSLQLPPSTVEQAIENAALGPASVTVGNQTVTAKDIDQLIEADKYLSGRQAAANQNFGLRLRKFTFPGAG